ncbi:hypothetical protein FF38_12516 [Lucilia cuprina]|uniref:Uncharacterized protein n=1 Tax=Lucilia cuprina TaxID=7375 RepID=A0A0L0C1F6_LUCCU|nr:hypothetical protein FF38_12516 [Lucilia cuprina]
MELLKQLGEENLQYGKTQSITNVNWIDYEKETQFIADKCRFFGKELPIFLQIYLAALPTALVEILYLGEIFTVRALIDS